MKAILDPVYRTRRMFRGRVERDYGAFNLRYVAERVAKLSIEKHPASLVVVEPIERAKALELGLRVQ